MKFDTLLVHAGEPLLDGAAVAPIWRSTVYRSQPGESYHDIRYPRLNQAPDHRLLHARMRALEGAEAALVSASGMATISSTLDALLSPGDHALIQGDTYGATRAYVQSCLLPRGVEVSWIDPDDPDGWDRRARPETRLIYLEALSNPLLRVADLAALGERARRAGWISVVDATFLSPLLVRPLSSGADLVLHSATKYLNGHSDVTAGVISGRGDLIERLRRHACLSGGSLDPQAASLLSRGIKTLGLRLRRQSQTALQLAQALLERPEVSRVYYPGLESHPGHALTQAWTGEGYGGMLGLELRGGLAEAEAFCDALEIPLRAPSLGGVESLVTLPAQTSHASIRAEERAALGIADGLVRLSVGIEDPDDLLRDLLQALTRAVGDATLTSPY